MFGFIRRNPFITILATAVGITAAFFPPVLLLTAFAGAGTIGAFVAATAITGVVATAVAFGALKTFSTFVEWLSPIMFPAAVINEIVSTEDGFEEVQPETEETPRRPNQTRTTNVTHAGSHGQLFFQQKEENHTENSPASDKKNTRKVFEFSI